jgi:hypothetical protein
VVALLGRHRSHEVFLLAVSAFLGLAYLFGSPPPGSLQALMPKPIFYAWATVLLVSGTVGLAGCYWPRRMDVALELERGAMTLQVAGLLLYTAVLFGYAGWQALASGGISIAWAVANGYRAWQISKLLRQKPVNGEL